jgi:hypothetical protein
MVFGASHRARKNGVNQRRKKSDGSPEFVIVGCAGKDTHTNVYRAPNDSFERDGKILVPNDALPIVLAVLDGTSKPYKVSLKPPGFTFEIPYCISHTKI